MRSSSTVISLFHLFFARSDYVRSISSWSEAIFGWIKTSFSTKWYTQTHTERNVPMSQHSRTQIGIRMQRRQLDECNFALRLNSNIFNKFILFIFVLFLISGLKWNDRFLPYSTRSICDSETGWIVSTTFTAKLDVWLFLTMLGSYPNRISAKKLYMHTDKILPVIQTDPVNAWARKWSADGNQHPVFGHPKINRNVQFIAVRFF